MSQGRYGFRDLVPATCLHKIHSCISGYVVWCQCWFRPSDMAINALSEVAGYVGHTWNYPRQGIGLFNWNPSSPSSITKFQGPQKILIFRSLSSLLIFTFESWLNATPSGILSWQEGKMNKCPFFGAQWRKGSLLFSQANPGPDLLWHILDHLKILEPTSRLRVWGGGGRELWLASLQLLLFIL